MNKKQSGTLGESIVLAEIMRRGYEVSIPFSDNVRYDLVVERKGKLERVQVKRVTAKKGKLAVATKTMMYDKAGGSNNRNRMVKYKTGDFDWLAVVDEQTSQCYFVPMSEINGKAELTLRLEETKNKQASRVRMAKDFIAW